MRGYDDLLRLLDEGAALVFPTEESARAFSSDYVLRTGKGLLASSCMAFDRFAARFYREAEGTREADDAARYMFSCYASRALSGRLGYFAPESYPEMQNRLPSFFRSILPLLDEAAALPKKSREAMASFTSPWKTHTGIWPAMTARTWCRSATRRWISISSKPSAQKPASR